MSFIDNYHLSSAGGRLHEVGNSWGGAEAKRCVDGYRFISFDVFETLLRREGIFRPIDLFLEMGHRAPSSLGLKASEFAQLRMRAERDARCKSIQRDHEEVLLAEIYQRLNALLPSFGLPLLGAGELKKLMQNEIDVELSYLRPVPELAEIYHSAIAADRTVILISDFYADQSFIEKALARNGFHHHQALYVSSTLGLTKHSGNLYKYVCETLGAAPKEILHFGDNAWSDGARASQAGIANIRVSNPTNEMTRRQGLDWRVAAPLLTSRMNSQVASLLFSQGVSARGPSDLTVPERVGVEALGPLLLGMASWLYAEAERHGFDGYYFCARDGFVIKRAFDLYQNRFGARISTHYLEISRQVIYRARAAMCDDDIEELFMQNWSGLTPSEALSRWGLEPEEFKQEIRAANFSDADEIIPIGDPEKMGRFSRLFHACRDHLIAANQAHAEKLQAYLKSAGLTQARAPCLVDIGWHGSLQKGLGSALIAAGESVPIAGRYVGLFLDDTQLRSLPAVGYLFSRDHTPLARALRASPSLVELLHTAGHGSTVGYEFRNGLPHAEFENRPDEEEQFRTFISPIQESALNFVEEILSEQILRPEPIAPKTAFAGLNRLLNAPEGDEIEHLGSLRIAANYGAKAVSTALIERSPEGYRLWQV